MIDECIPRQSRNKEDDWGKINAGGGGKGRAR